MVNLEIKPLVFLHAKLLAFKNYQFNLSVIDDLEYKIGVMSRGRLLELGDNNPRRSVIKLA